MFSTKISWAYISVLNASLKYSTSCNLNNTWKSKNLANCRQYMKKCHRAMKTPLQLTKKVNAKCMFIHYFGPTSLTFRLNNSCQHTPYSTSGTSRAIEENEFNNVIKCVSALDSVFIEWEKKAQSIYDGHIQTDSDFLSVYDRCRTLMNIIKDYHGKQQDIQDYDTMIKGLSIFDFFSRGLIKRISVACTSLQL